MNEQLFRDFITVCEAQIKHIAKHHAELAEIHGADAAVQQLKRAVDVSETLTDLVEALDGSLNFEDLIINSCWRLAGLWIDLSDDADFADFIHGRALMSNRERNP
jgi:hypothetical protein